MDRPTRWALAGGLSLVLTGCGAAPETPAVPSISFAPPATARSTVSTAPTTTPTTTPELTTTTPEPAPPVPAPPVPKPPAPRPPAPKPAPAPPKPAPPKPSCDPSYPTVCIAPAPPDLDCGQIPYKRFKVLAPDPHGFDNDHDGIGCE